MNVAEALTALLDTEAAIAALESDRAKLRQAVADKAAADYAETGTAQTYRSPVGTASWAGAGKTEAVIADPQTFGEWVAEEYPSEAELVIRIPMSRVHSEQFEGIKDRLLLLASGSGTEVQPAFTKRLLASGAALDGSLVTDAGTVVAGVVVRPKTPHLSIRFSPEAKARAAAGLATEPVPPKIVRAAIAAFGGLKGPG